MNRCTGHCCENFTLPYTPMELKHRAKRLKVGDKYFHEDHTQVAEMVIFLGTYASGTDRRGRKKIKGTKLYYGKSIHHYTCKHYNRETRNCMNYENRPAMCRNYPDGHKCNYRGCTLKQDIQEEEKLQKVEECSK